MKTHRTLSGLVVTALLGLAPVVTAVTASSAGDLPEREISSKIVETRLNQQVMKGNVSPGHARQPVFIQKRDCLKKRCDWYKFNKVQTNKKGGFSSRVTAPRKGYDYWRAMVKAHDGYATSYSRVWRTYTT